MAASAVYVSLVRLRKDSEASDSFTMSNANASSATFALKGGTYTIDVLATMAAGSVTLQRLGPDGSTFLTATTAFTVSPGTATLDLPAGTYKVAVA